MTWDAFPLLSHSTSRRSPASLSPLLLVVHLRPSPPPQAKRLCTLVDGHLCKRTFVLATAICLSDGRLIVYICRQKFACVCTFVNGRLLVSTSVDRNLRMCVHN